MNFESEIEELKRRVGDLEGAVSVLTGHSGKVHPDLIKLTNSTAASFDRMEALVGKVAGRLDLLNTQVWSLRDDLPQILAEANALSGRRDPGDTN